MRSERHVFVLSQPVEVTIFVHFVIRLPFDVESTTIAKESDPSIAEGRLTSSMECSQCHVRNLCLASSYPVSGMRRRAFARQRRELAARLVSFGANAWDRAALLVVSDEPTIARRFVVGVLRDEFALDGEGEDGFAEVGGGDGVGSWKRKLRLAGVGASAKRASDARASAACRVSRSCCCASSRSHNAINSSTFATIRFCSARGGRGMEAIAVRLEDCWRTVLSRLPAL